MAGQLPSQLQVIRAIGRSAEALGGLQSSLLRLVTDAGTGVDANQSLARPAGDAPSATGAQVQAGQSKASHWEVDRVIEFPVNSASTPPVALAPCKVELVTEVIEKEERAQFLDQNGLPYAGEVVLSSPPNDGAGTNPVSFVLPGKQPEALTVGQPGDTHALVTMRIETKSNDVGKVYFGALKVTPLNSRGPDTTVEVEVMFWIDS